MPRWLSLQEFLVPDQTTGEFSIECNPERS
jgi:hypothetical protein